MFYVVPRDPARLSSGPQAGPQVERQREALGLADPLWEQYGNFLWRIVRHQSTGFSLAVEQDAAYIAFRATPATLSLLGAGLVVVLVLAVPLGLPAGRVRRPKMLGRVPVYLAVGAKPLWLGLLLSYHVGYQLSALPIGGYCDSSIRPKTLPAAARSTGQRVSRRRGGPGADRSGEA